MSRQQQPSQAEIEEWVRRAKARRTPPTELTIRQERALAPLLKLLRESSDDEPS